MFCSLIVREEIHACEKSLMLGCMNSPHGQDVGSRNLLPVFYLILYNAMQEIKMLKTSHFDEVLRSDPVELEVPGEPVHAAAKLDLGVHLVGEGLAPHPRMGPLQHRLEPSLFKSELELSGGIKTVHHSFKKSLLNISVKI